MKLAKDSQSGVLTTCGTGMAVIIIPGDPDSVLPFLNLRSRSSFFSSTLNTGKRKRYQAFNSGIRLVPDSTTCPDFSTRRVYCTMKCNISNANEYNTVDVDMRAAMKIKNTLRSSETQSSRTVWKLIKKPA